jgi:hypothetical protein
MSHENVGLLTSIPNEVLSEQPEKQSVVYMYDREGQRLPTDPEADPPIILLKEGTNSANPKEPDAEFAFQTYECWPPPATSVRYHWLGRELDVEANLMYNRAICYHPTTGYWISDAPLGWERANDDRFPYPTDCEGNAVVLPQ